MKVDTMEMSSDTVSVTEPHPFIQWAPIIAGALAAAALTFVLLSFGSAIGLSVASTSPTWRDASAALALLSGFFLILQALVSFALGGYVAGRTSVPRTARATAEVERRDGAHGLMSWALAVMLGACLAALVGGLAASRATSPAQQASAAEPLLSYEIDRLLRTPRRPANLDLTHERAEIGRILLTAASHNGVAPDDRTYLIQQVGALTGSPPDAERRVDDALGKSRAAIRKSRQTAVIFSFSAAAAVLLGAVAAWGAAVAGGRHRDGEPLPTWMRHGDLLTRRRGTVPASRETIERTPGPLPG